MPSHTVTDQNDPTRRTESAVRSRRTGRRAWLITAMLVVFMIINWGDKTVLGLAAGPLIKELHLTSAQYGVVAGSFFFLFSAFTVLSGWLLNRVKTKWLLFAMALLWALLQFPVVAAASLGVLMASRIALGAAEGPAMPTALHAVMKWFPDQRRDIPNSLIYTGTALGLVLAAPGLSLIISRWGWRAAFVALGIAGVAWALLWLMAGKEGPLDVPRRGKPAVAAESPEPAVRVSYLRLFTSGTWLSFACATFAVYWMASIAITWLPLYLENVMGAGPARVGVLMSVVGMGSGLAMFGQGVLARGLMALGVSSRWARSGLAGAAVVVSAAGVVAFTQSTGGALQVVLMVLAFALGAPCFSAATAAVAEVAPAGQRGAAFSLLLGIETSAGIVAPIVTGRIIGAADAPAAGYHHAFLLGAALLFVTGLCVLVFARPSADKARLISLAERAATVR